MNQLTKKRTVAQTIVFGFLIILVVGAILLMLPISAQEGTWTNPIDALFTATSALCVTGQVTLNTADHWSFFGQIVILLLIETGGLGFMTILVLIYLILGKKMDLKQRKVIQEALNLDDLSETQKLIRMILKFSFVIQFVGALVLSLDFIPRYGWLRGIWFSLFHSISSFCNAGFDLFGDSLNAFTSNPLVLFTISTLIVIGGLGFIVWQDLITWRKNRRLLLHTRLVLYSTIILLFGAFVLFSVSESLHGTFASIPASDHWFNLLFMSVTPRTAGFSHINYAMVSKAGLLITLILMFIGGAPGSTAGGIKVTTIATLIIYLINGLKDKHTVFAWRTIPHSRVKKAVMVLVIGLLLTTIASFILLLTEAIPEGYGIEYILIEVFSCFGTVGLTMGLTPNLSIAGKFILMILMFIGRTGLLTFFWSFNAYRLETRVNYPEENILIG